MATTQQREYNRQPARETFTERKPEPLSPVSWWVGVDRQTFPAIAREARKRMKRSSFARNWTTEPSE